MERKKTKGLHNWQLIIFVLVLLFFALPVFAQEEGIVNTNAVNMRQGPGTSYAAITQVQDGQALYILKTQNNWFQVRLQTGVEGWIRSDLVDRVIKNIKVTGSSLNVRKGPGTNYNIVGKVYAGQILSVVAEKNNWLKVRLKSLKDAWIAASYTVKVNSGDTSNTGANTGANQNTGTNIGTDSGGGLLGHVMVNTNVLNVRKGPGTGYALVTKIGLYEKHDVLAQQNGWYKIKVNNMEGWVSPDYVQYYPVANNSGNPVPSPINPGGGQLPSAVKVTGNAVSIRQAADLDAPVIGQVNAGDFLSVLDYQNSWYRVRLADGQIGWIINWYVQPHDGSVPSRGVPKKDLLIVPIAEGKTFKVVDNGGKPELILEGWSREQFRFKTTNKETKLILELDGYSTRKYEGKIERLNISMIRIYPEGSREIVEMEFNYVPVPGSGQTDGKNVTEIPIGVAAQRGLSGKTIVVDPGHASVQPGGSPDPGALGSRTKIHEKDVNLAIALKLKALLEQNGARVIMTHMGQTTLSLSGRAAIANNLPADMFVSVHSNYNNKPAVAGHTTYFYAPITNPFLYSQLYARQRLASLVQREVVKSGGRKDNGILQDNFAVLRETTVPSILVETAYLSNWEEEQLLSQDWFRQKIAEGICNGIKSYFN